MVGYGEVQSAIPVQIANGDGVRIGPSRVLGLRLEAAGAIAKQNRNGIGASIGYGEIQSAVPVQVAHGDCVRISPGRDLGLQPERTVAVAQQNQNCVGIKAGVAGVYGERR
jgi:hypothetical protein